MFSYLLLLVSSVTFADSREEIRRLNKPMMEVQLDILKQEQVVPKKLFRGDSNPLRFTEVDPASGTTRVNPAAFRERFIGEKSYFLDRDKPNPIGKARRGAYATGSLRTNSYYNRTNLVEFTLTEACRNPKRVASLGALPKDPRFRDWLAMRNRFEEYVSGMLKSPLSVQGVIDFVARNCAIDLSAVKNRPYKGLDEERMIWLFECSPEIEASGPFYLSLYQQLGVKEVATEEQARTRAGWCDQVASSFLEENHIGVLLDEYDSMNPAESFYIRDPSCIESVTYRPEDWIKLLGSVDYEFLFENDVSTERVKKGQYVCRLPQFATEVLRKSQTTPTLEILETLLKNLSLLPDISEKDAPEEVAAKKSLLETLSLLQTRMR